MEFFNTTLEALSNLTIYTTKAKTQNEIILNIIKAIKQPFSASMIHKMYPNNNTPITSVRRSLNTLKNKGLIIETGDKIKSPYNRNEFLYKLS